VGKIGRAFCTIVIALTGANAAFAETLTVSGWYAAEERSPSLLRSLSVDRFDGDDGPSLVYEIERKLAAAQDRDRKPYFEIRSRYAKTDGVVHGDIRTRIENVNFTRKAKRCPGDIYSTKCKDDVKVQVYLYCIRRIVTVSPNVQITRVSDDRRIYSQNLPQRDETESCEGERKASDIDNVIKTLVRKAADEFGNQITPSALTEKIRVRESRSGMSKADSNQMKSLIAATKQSESAACAGWRDMEERRVSHPTLTFNLGLCAESAGDLDTALRYYRPLAASKNSSDANASITRIERRVAGDEDDRLRNKTPSKL
jgi:hypothetical protein